MKHYGRTTAALVFAGVILSGISVYAGCWVQTYWPLHSGDWKTLVYSKPSGPENVDINVYSTGFGEYQVSVNTPEDNGYEIHRIEGAVVWIPKVSVNSGWIKVYFDPPIYFLDDNLLMNGGTKRWTTTATQSGVDYTAVFTITVGLAGTVTVPAGTFHNCRNITVSETATVPGQGTFSAQFMTAVLAPRVGIIKKLVLEENGQYWAQLTGGTVGGISVSQLAGSAASLPAAITAQPRSLSATHGGKATFSVTAKGSADMQYQWLKDEQPIQNGDRISGARTATLTINHVSLADEGRYSATISNSACVVLSTNAWLDALTDIPKVAISFPVNGQRVSNDVVTVRGTTADNLGIGEITVRVNSGSFVPASTTNNWTNWTAEVALPVAGTNWLVARAVDLDGITAYATNRLQYVLSGPLVVGINGKGTINPNYHGKLLEIGKLHSMTATPAVGYAFSNWTDAVGMLITNKTMLSFVMQSNLVFNANFADIQKPVVTITAPTLNQRWSNVVFTVAGKATDNGGVAQVVYQLNGGDWTSASTANAWSNWTASVTLTPGPNTIRAYGVDATGNRSTTNTVSMTYVLSGPLVVGITGKGTVAPNYHGKLLEIGKLHSITATPAVGYAFSNWTDAVGTVITNKTMLSFVMQSNLVFNANFADIQKPVVAITAPTLNQRWSNAVFTVAGKVTDNGGVAQVVYQLNGGDWTSASTANAWSNWTASVTLTPGPNTVRAYAVDATGNRSITNTVTMTYVLSGPLVVGINGKGTINPNYHGKLLEIGKLHSMTATPAVGYAFSNWTDAVEMVITNKAMLSFVMQSNLVFNANFADTQKPVVTITAPTLNQRWSNAVFSVAGKATDNGGVAQVVYQLNGGDWTSASTANAWSNWTASVTLTPGSNTVRAYALDTTGNRSLTNTVTMTYVMTYWLPGYYYPSVVGSRWIYDGKDWDGFPAQMEVRITDTNFPITCYSGTTAIKSFTRYVIREQSAYGAYDPNTGNFFSNDAWEDYITLSNGWGMLGSEDTPESIRVDPPLLITNRLIVGQTVSQTRNIYLDGTYQGQATFKLQLLDVADVTVPAGTFSGCLHVRLTLSAGGSSQVHDDWMAPSVGMVKQQGVSGDGAPERWELIRSFVPSPAGGPALVTSTTRTLNQPCTSSLAAESSASAAPQPNPAVQFAYDVTMVTAAGARMQLRLTGPPGSLVVVESSADLQHWLPIRTNAVPAEGVSLSVPINQFPQQFFRARLR